MQRQARGVEIFSSDAFTLLSASSGVMQCCKRNKRNEGTFFLEYGSVNDIRQRLSQNTRGTAECHSPTCPNAVPHMWKGGLALQVYRKQDVGKLGDLIASFMHLLIAENRSYDIRDYATI